jgi:hypothetical protein
MTDSNDVPKLPARADKSNGSAKKSKALDRIRNATPTRPLASGLGRADLLAAAIAPQQRPRLGFAFDATASREPAWNTARQITDALFTALPGQLDVALAVHGGGWVHTFIEFSSHAGVFRDQAASVHCQAGSTALVSLMEQVRTHAGVKVLLYIGDCFEEDPAAAFEQADALRLRGVRAILFHDAATGNQKARTVFEEIARRTGGACLDFHGAGANDLHDILEAVAVLAYGGVKLLQQRKGQLPGARRLLPFVA